MAACSHPVNFTSRGLVLLELFLGLIFPASTVHGQIFRSDYDAAHLSRLW